MISPFIIYPHNALMYNDEVVIIEKVCWLSKKELYPTVIYYKLNERLENYKSINLYKAFWIDFVLNAQKLQ